MPEPYQAYIPVGNPDTKLQEFVWMPVLLIHEMVAWLLGTNRVAMNEVAGDALPVGSAPCFSLAVLLILVVPEVLAATPCY